MLADPHWLHQVITNLLTNALKFTPADGRVTISTRSIGTEAVLRVADTGAGIPADNLPRIFDRFFLRGQQAAQISGSGIGLTVAAELVQAHQRPADRRQRARSWHSDDPQLAFGLASPFLHTVPIATSSRLRSARLGWNPHAETEVTRRWERHSGCAARAWPRWRRW